MYDISSMIQVKLFLQIYAHQIKRSSADRALERHRASTILIEQLK
jgi:hypothetical protein